MATYGLSRPARADWWGEVRAAMKEALQQSRGVLITAIVCITLLAMGLLGSLALLAYVQRDASTILGLVNLLFTAIVWAKTHRVEKQTNGTTSRLMDAALKDKQ